MAENRYFDARFRELLHCSEKAATNCMDCRCFFILIYIKAITSEPGEYPDR
ncbi:MAG: hypothetical protein JWN60_507 [Acidobacteria bacterium]|nr:hypothetical protein [Acidobacteriota bacterium]